MPYHIRVTQRSDPTSDEVKLDLSREQLEERFVSHYREGRPIVIGGKTIVVDDIERIRVTETEETSPKLLPKVKVERLSSGFAVAGISDEWLVADHGKDVTDEFITGPPGTVAAPRESVKPDAARVLVVYGRNAEARQAIFDFLRSIELRPLEWAQAVAATKKASPYIGEILDAAFGLAQAVVVLMTPDDEGRLRGPLRHANDPPFEAELTPQARLNVIFEAGMAMGRNPDRTLLVELGDLRHFSDVGGRHVIRLDDTVGRRQELALRLQTAGCPANLAGTDWHRAGDFARALTAFEGISPEVVEEATPRAALPGREPVSREQASRLLRNLKSTDPAVRVEALRDLQARGFRYSVLDHPDLAMVIEGVLKAGTDEERAEVLNALLSLVQSPMTPAEENALERSAGLLRAIAESVTRADVASRAYDTLVMMGNSMGVEVLKHWIIEANDARYTALQPLNFLRVPKAAALKDALEDAMYELLREKPTEIVRKRVSEVLSAIRYL